MFQPFVLTGSRIAPEKIHGGVISLWLFFLQLHLHRQQQLSPDESGNTTVLEQSTSDLDEREKYRKSGLSADDMEKIIKRIGIKMEESRCYLDPDLTLTGLAKLIGTPRHHISQALNSTADCNFYLYINSRRLGEFEAALRENRWPQLSLLGVAMECGFKSSSSFYNAVRRIRNMTPGALARQLREES